MLSALIETWYNCRPEAGSSEASAFVGAIHRIVTTLAQLKESPTLLPLAGTLAIMSIQLMPEKTWSPGSAGTTCLHALVHAVRDMPAALANIREILFEQRFITAGEWEQLLPAMQDKSS